MCKRSNMKVKGLTISFMTLFCVSILSFHPYTLQGHVIIDSVYDSLQGVDWITCTNSPSAQAILRTVQKNITALINHEIKCTHVHMIS